MPQQSERPRIAGIVLAAGASTRMGTNKMMLELGGEALVRRAVRRALGAGLDPVVVVIGHEPDRVREALADLPVQFATNPDFTGPTSGSLHKGLEALSEDTTAAVIMLGDMVGVGDEMVRVLVAALSRSDAPLAVSRYGDVLAPPLLFRRAMFGELLAWNGEGCGKAVVMRHREEAVFVDWPVEALADVDTPGDFAALVEGDPDVLRWRLE